MNLFDPIIPYSIGFSLQKVEKMEKLHKIIAINGKRIQIGNNKGKVNGWTTKERIFGKYIKTVDLQSCREMSVYPAE